MKNTLHSLTLATLGQLPKRIILAFVDQQAFSGTFTSNPYDFQTFSHDFLDLRTDSTLSITPLEPNFDKNLYMQSYNSLFYATGIHFKDCGLGISHSDYKNGFCLSCFDLTPDLSSSESHLSPNLTGILGLQIKFARTLTKPVTLIVYSEYSNMVEVDRYRSVSTDFKR